MLRLPPVETLPSVASALGWLLDKDNAASDDILREAHDRGLIDAASGLHFKADGRRIEPLLRAALRRRPLGSEALGVIFHGLGELSARSHCRSTYPVQSFLRYHRERLDLAVILDVAASLDDRSRARPNFEAVAAAQWLAGARLGWSDLLTAHRRIEHPWLDSGGVYGFAFVVRAVLRVDLSVLDRWMIANPQHLGLATVASILSKLALKPRALVPVLESAVPACRLIAAAALLSPFRQPAEVVRIRDIVATLVAARFDPRDAIWIAGYRLKEAIHSRYRLEDGLEKSEARLRYIARQPDGAMGGMQQADFEKRSLNQRIEGMRAAYADLVPQIEGMLVDLAIGWPSEGLSNDRLMHLEHVFVELAEMRFRLAEKLSCREDRHWLLQRNRTQVRDYLGLASPGTALDRPLYLTEQFASRTAPWTARSFVLLYDGDDRGIGRITSNFLSGLTTELERLLRRPFIAARAPMRWETAAARAACTYLFALNVAAAVPATHRKDAGRLNGYVLEHARELFLKPLPYLPDIRLFDRLAAHVAHSMSLFDVPDGVREKWLLCADLPDFSRALVLWTAPDLVAEHGDLAIDLFKRVGSLPSSSAADRGMSNLLTLLDHAVASCTQAHRGDLLERVIDQWTLIYADWLPVASDWSDAAREFAAAAAGEGPEREKLVADSAFANTQCRSLIESSRNGNREAIEGDPH